MWKLLAELDEEVENLKSLMKLLLLVLSHSSNDLLEKTVAQILVVEGLVEVVDSKP